MVRTFLTMLKRSWSRLRTLQSSRTNWSSWSWLEYFNQFGGKLILCIICWEYLLSSDSNMSCCDVGSLLKVKVLQVLTKFGPILLETFSPASSDLLLLLFFLILFKTCSNTLGSSSKSSWKMWIYLLEIKKIKF